MFKKILLIIFLLTIQGCSGWKVNIMGIDTDWIGRRNGYKIVAGALTRLVVHEVAHFAVAKAYGLDFEMDGFDWRTNETNENVSRAGFVAQVGIGSLLNIIPATKSDDFTLGWNVSSAFSGLLYPIRYDKRDGDFSCLNYSEWGLYTTLGAANLIWTLHNMEGK